MTDSRFAIVLVLMSSAAAFGGGCEDEVPSANQTGGVDGTGEGGDGPSAAGSHLVPGGTTHGGGLTGSGGALVGGGTGEGGTGGASACVMVECEGLDEATCDGLDPKDEFVGGGCRTIYGHPWPAMAGAGGEANVEYAGCRTLCCSGDCEEPTSGGCAHPADEPSNCWTLTSSHTPDGWVLLTDVPECDRFSQCSE